MTKGKKTEEPEIDDETAEWNDICCVECGRKYRLVDGSSNCRCKRCNILYKLNHNIEFHPHAKNS